MSFGQFAHTHDLSFTIDLGPFGEDPLSCQPAFTRKGSIPNSHPRAHANEKTAWFDLGPVYGNVKNASNLRTFKDGLMWTSKGDHLPKGLKFAPSPPENPIFIDPEEIPESGDFRTGENTFLGAFHLLFLREHNRLARAYKKSNPHWSDEDIFQKARAINIAQYQQIVYYEYSPVMVGEDFFMKHMEKYKGYDDDLRVGIFAEFSAGVNRFPHAQVNDEVLFVFANGGILSRKMTELFENAGILTGWGLETIVQGMIMKPAQEIGPNYADSMVHEGGFHLIDIHLGAADCFRSRDYGLPSVAEIYKILKKRGENVKVPKTIADLTSDVAYQTFLSAWNSVDDMDLWAAIAEDHIPGAAVGPVFAYIYRDQMKLLRDGDRFWFESGKNDMLSEGDIRRARKTKLSDIILRNTDLKCVPEEAFYAPGLSPLKCKKNK